MWRIKGFIRGTLAMIFGREWLSKKTHDDIFKNIKKDKRRSKDNWCLVSSEYFQKIKEGYKNTWENKMTSSDRESWLKLYGKDILELIEDLELKEYESFNVFNFYQNYEH